MSRTARTLAALILLLALCGPVAAQSTPRGSQPAGLLASSVSWLWARISTPVSHLLKGRSACDPNGTQCKPTALPPVTDGGGGCDPNGILRCNP